MDTYIEIGSGGQAIGYPVLAQNLGYVFPYEPITPENMIRHGYQLILDNPPAITDSQRLDKLGFSKKSDGTISYDYQVVELTREEALTRLIRFPRAQLIAACDWTQTADAPLTAEQKAAWATYRQQLRDLTKVFSDAVNASDIIWPNNPHVIAAKANAANLPTTPAP